MKFHGCVVAAMYGIPPIMLITTDKFRNFYRMIEREELAAHHRHEDLPDRLNKYMARVPWHSRHAVREKAEQGLRHLSEIIRAEIST
jgi:polysaccharide pyruvyl transferase WcaK-like protein